jgi:hypothetical protein
VRNDEKAEDAYMICLDKLLRRKKYNYKINQIREKIYSNEESTDRSSPFINLMERQESVEMKLSAQPYVLSLFLKLWGTSSLGSGILAITSLGFIFG